MSIAKNIFVGAICIAIAAAVWISPEARAQLGLLTNLVQNNGVLVFAALLPVIFVMIFAIVASSARARRRKRDLDEYLRVQAQNSDQTQPTTPEKTVISNDLSQSDGAKATKIGGTQSATPFTGLSVISGGKNKKEAKPTAPPAPLSVSDELFFQPVFSMPDGELVGYDVFREAMIPSRVTPLFIQGLANQTLEVRAAFENEMIEFSVAAMPLIIQDELGSIQTNRLFVHLSDALLGDADCLKNLSELLRGHKALTNALCLCLDVTAVAASEQAALNTRVAQMEKLGQLGVEIALCGSDEDLKKITPQQLAVFGTYICDTQNLLISDSDESGKLLSEKTIIFCRNVLSDADVVDTMANGATLMSGPFFAMPKKLKSPARFSPAEQAS